MSIVLESFLKQGADFLPIPSWPKKIKGMYITGGIRLSIDGVDLFTLEEWDLIDQLWAYLIECARNLRDGNDFSTYFPDSPIHFRAQCSSTDSVFLTVDVPSHPPQHRETRVNKQEFVRAILCGAREFFIAILPSVYGRNRRGFESLLRDIASIEENLPN